MCHFYHSCRRGISIYKIVTIGGANSHPGCFFWQGTSQFFCQLSVSHVSFQMAYYVEFILDGLRPRKLNAFSVFRPGLSQGTLYFGLVRRLDSYVFCENCGFTACATQQSHI